MAEMDRSLVMLEELKKNFKNLTEREKSEFIKFLLLDTTSRKIVEGGFYSGPSPGYQNRGYFTGPSPQNTVARCATCGK